MISHQDILNYMQSSVAAFQGIADSDFYRLDLTELQSSIRTGINSPCVLLESHEGNFENSKANNSIDNKSFAFLVLKLPESGNFDEQNQYLDDCEIIGKKFLARMRYHSTQKDHLLYGCFDISLCSYHKVGPIFTGGWYGYRFEVALKPKKTDLKVSPGDWSDIDTAC